MCTTFRREAAALMKCVAVSKYSAPLVRGRPRPNGYALLLVMFFVALLVLAVSAATPNMMTQIRREKEQEMIWRGKQYVQGIRLYRQRTHRFPTQLEELYTNKTGIRFMRKAYKDPMNGLDGSWRLISVGPAGQLVGSLRERQNAFFFGAAAPSGFGGALSLSSNTGGFGNTPRGSQDSTTISNNAALIPGTPADQSSSNSDSGSAPATPPPTVDSTDDRPAPGESIIVGVGSKVNRASTLHYEGAKNYLQFEFIWNAVDGGLGVPGVPSP
jgi:hypothetical protein